MQRQGVNKDAENKTELEDNSRNVISTDNSEVEEIKTENEEDDDEEVFIAFARVFSGSLRKGMKLYVLGPKYDPMKGLNLKRESEEEQDVDVESICR